ncbi:MAG: 30S ribosomal protein S17 [Firmicutes bacterium]|nr:30S ribosomal protein S17 [Candidatus Alectryobacillus merdavium]
MERKTRRVIQGEVISNKNAKTITVLVETYKRHPKYGKRVKYAKKYYAHDENNVAKVGDIVTIMECRKLSALKRFRLVAVVKHAEMDLKKEEELVEKELEKQEGVAESTEKVEA